MISAMLQIPLLFEKRRQPPKLVPLGRFDANHFVSLLGKEPSCVGSAESSQVDDAKHLFHILRRTGKFLIWKHGECMAPPQDNLLM